MSLVFRRRVKLDDHTAANVSRKGVSISHRRGRVSINSRGRLSVRLFRGLSWRSK
jgi:hypothetical protein